VTFEVNTNQAQRLALAQQVGRLSLTLRGFGEATDEKMAPVTADQLSDLGAAPKEEISKVRVRRGTQLSDVRIDGSTESSADGQGEPAPAPAPAN
jgi:Flp pilus assembly protein CpaB